MRRMVGATVLLLAIAAAVGAAGHAGAAGTMVKVYADGDGGWRFNPDPANATPYEMTTYRWSIGSGSLYVQPIANVLENGRDRFVAELPLALPSTDLASVSYDFLIAGPAGTPDRARDFSLQVNVSLPGSTKAVDCRFDYIPTAGSIEGFTTASFAVDRPTRVVSIGTACSATPAAMPAGSTISAMSLNVGHPNGKDTGLAGYLDNVVVVTTSGTTTYDFDVRTTLTKDDCKDEGWRHAGFPNQGTCVASVQAAEQGRRA